MNKKQLENELKEITPEQWAKWYTHKSNKERCIEQEEEKEEEKEMETEEKDIKL